MSVGVLGAVFSAGENKHDGERCAPLQRSDDSTSRIVTLQIVITDADPLPCGLVQQLLKN